MFSVSIDAPSKLAFLARANVGHTRATEQVRRDVRQGRASRGCRVKACSCGYG